MEHNPENIKNSILEKIRTKEVSMRPKIYFALRVAALVATSIAMLLVTVFIINFISFSIRINSHEALLGFGPRGIEAFLLFFPWELLAFDIALVLLLVWLMRSFRFGYMTPALYLGAGLFALILVSGVLIDRGSTLNDHFIQSDEWHRPPPGSGICRCTIVAIDGTMLVLEEARRGATTSITVVLPLDNPRATTTGLSVGDVVMVLGDDAGGVIRAFGVRKVSPHKK
ncbi:MAG: hypothetical protein AAB573_02925 [Patescibacteria group bacterium]